MIHVRCARWRSSTPWSRHVINVMTIAPTTQSAPRVSTDFSCSVSPAMHADVMGLVAGGHTAQEILAAFKAIYGEKVLMAPNKSGFNLVGYTMPFVALAAGAVIVSALLKRWRQRAPQVATVTPHVDATAEELDAINAAVRRDA